MIRLALGVHVPSPHTHVLTSTAMVIPTSTIAGCSTKDRGASEQVPHTSGVACVGDKEMQLGQAFCSL